ncbi:MAG: hypothetical protein WBA68_08845 [Alteraurantiacibacter sp.]
MLKRLLLVIAAFFALPGAAASQDLEGYWAFQIDDAVIFLFALDRTADGEWRGQWVRPQSFRGNGVVFSQFRGGEAVTTTEFAVDGETVELRFPPTREEGSTDILRFEPTGENEARMHYVGVELPPFPLVRVARSTALGPFEDERLYDRDNAVTESSYDPADDDATQTEVEAVEGSVEDDDVGDAGTEDIAEAAEEVVEEDEAGEGSEGTPRIAGDFLDGIGTALAKSEVTGDDASDTEPTELSRACADLDRSDLPNRAGLDVLWGDDFEAIGDGLEIREYRMDNGDIARVTMLDDRIYLNRCGPA